MLADGSALQHRPPIRPSLTTQRPNLTTVSHEYFWKGAINSPKVLRFPRPQHNIGDEGVWTLAPGCALQQTRAQRGARAAEARPIKKQKQTERRPLNTRCSCRLHLFSLVPF
ncbi:hypothetical protein NDU88_007546 [Pleurodeles waltl]|uniref:Uncharacterized protein n=1 Tax=Pleurodeles waltl TaxID=8319 RepID=A0AAV7PQ98_PLEWA|nr:hypothetical protein NDU88_007546 [Pleurodeles waltl]